MLAIKAGNDVVLHSPDDAAAVAGIKAAVEKGEIPIAQIDASVRRILRAKARLGLHKTKLVSLDDVPKRVGGRANAAVAQRLSAEVDHADQGRPQSGAAPRAARGAVLYLSLLDYRSGWRIAAPSRTFIPELRRRWPNVTAIELSDRATASEIDLVRATATRYDAIVASVFVRAASGSGRMDLAPSLVRLLTDLAQATASTPKPVRDGVLRQPVRADGLADPAGDAADLRLLRSGRAVSGARASGRGADRRQAADRAAGPVRGGVWIGQVRRPRNCLGRRVQVWICVLRAPAAPEAEDEGVSDDGSRRLKPTD